MFVSKWVWSNGTTPIPNVHNKFISWHTILINTIDHHIELCVQAHTYYNIILTS